MNDDKNIEWTIQPDAFQVPIWYEGQTVFSLGGGWISWRNHLYKGSSKKMVKNAQVIVENPEKSIKRINLVKEQFLKKLKIVSITILIYTPVLLLVWEGIKKIFG